MKCITCIKLKIEKDSLEELLEEAEGYELALCEIREIAGQLCDPPQINPYTLIESMRGIAGLAEKALNK